MNKFVDLVEMALKVNELITIPNAENVIIWPETDAIIRCVYEGEGYTSIAIESEKHNVYAYWAPDYDPAFITCDASDFDKFYDMAFAIA